MKIVIIGSVAAGTSVAAKARRNTEEAEIVVYDQDKDISYSICGIPYYIGDEVEELDKLTPRNAAWFKKRYNVDIFTEHRVTAIHPETQTLEVENLQTKEKKTESYELIEIFFMFVLFKMLLPFTHLLKKKSHNKLLLLVQALLD